MTDTPYGARETQDPAQCEAAQFAAQFAALARQLAAARPACRALAARLPDGALAAPFDRAALARLPVLRKSDLLQARSAEGSADPFGGWSRIGWRTLGLAQTARRVFQSPGPLYEPEPTGGDPWRMARALWAAGARPGDLVHCSFSFHLTPAGAMMERAAAAIGCCLFPGGVGQSELQLQAMRDLRPSVYVGTRPAS